MSLARQADDWRSLGACLSADPDLFFPISAGGSSAAQINRARSICGACQVHAECLSYAFANQGIQGIWGGTTEDERKKLRRRDTAAVQRSAGPAVPADPARPAGAGAPTHGGGRTRAGSGRTAKRRQAA